MCIRDRSYIDVVFERASAFEWTTYSYRYYNKESEERFGQWAVAHDWCSVIRATMSNSKAEAYQGEVTDAIERFFPLKTTRKRSGDLPWINHAIRRRIRQRKAIFRREGRSATWKRLKKVTEEMLKKRKER